MRRLIGLIGVAVLVASPISREAAAQWSDSGRVFRLTSDSLTGLGHRIDEVPDDVRAVIYTVVRFFNDSLTTLRLARPVAVRVGDVSRPSQLFTSGLKECEDAYDYGAREIVLCDLPPDIRFTFWDGRRNVRYLDICCWTHYTGFVLLHELAHAIIHQYDLPEVGDIEAAADELATLLALGQGRGWLVFPYRFAEALDQLAQVESPSRAAATEHGVSAERAARIRCLFDGVVSHFGLLGQRWTERAEGSWEGLDPDRREECRQKAPRVVDEWVSLLGPIWKPTFEDALPTIR